MMNRIIANVCKHIYTVLSAATLDFRVMMVIVALMALYGTTNAIAASPSTTTAEYTIYQVYRPIDLGESDVPPPKDVFISMGTDQGVKKGSVLDVYRKVTSFDNLTQKHMGDHLIPVGRVKVIHAEAKNAIARLDKFVSIENEPALLPQAIMIGDLVRIKN
jgi:hypothetical protein